MQANITPTMHHLKNKNFTIHSCSIYYILRLRSHTYVHTHTGSITLNMEAAIEAVIDSIDFVEGDEMVNTVGDCIFSLTKELKVSTVGVEDCENEQNNSSFLVGRLLVAMRRGLIKFGSQLRASILRAMRYMAVSKLHVKTFLEYRLDVFIVMSLEREQVSKLFFWGGGRRRHGLLCCSGQINQTKTKTKPDQTRHGYP